MQAGFSLFNSLQQLAFSAHCSPWSPFTMVSFCWCFPKLVELMLPFREALKVDFRIKNEYLAIERAAGFPLASLIVFFGIYSGVANNSSFSRHIRVNAMQALLLSIVLM